MRRVWLGGLLVMLIVLASLGLLEGKTLLSRFSSEPDPYGPVDLPQHLQTGAVAPEKGKLAPDFRLQDLRGTPVRLSDLRGQVVLINFWATWCPPCRQEMPEIESVYRAYKERGLEVLAVNLEEDQQTVADFVARLGLTFPILLDARGTVSQRYPITAVPNSFFIDRSGVVREVRIGAMTQGLILDILSRVMETKP